MRASFMLMFCIVGVAGCRTVSGPPVQEAVNHFRIVLDQPAFTQDEASQWGIRATVTNMSKDQDFYANVGDAFNAALDQPDIYAALGTHAVIERRKSPSGWVNANAGALYEGSRFVVLSAGKSYRLEGSIAPDAPGTYRIRLDYSASNGDPSPTLPFHAYSATFVVR